MRKNVVSSFAGKNGRVRVLSEGNKGAACCWYIAALPCRRGKIKKNSEVGGAAQCGEISYSLLHIGLLKPERFKGTVLPS